MTTAEVLTAIQTSPVAHAITKSNHLVGAALQIVHIMGFITLLASLVLISLRLLGLVFPAQPLQVIAREATRLIWLGLGLTVVSGTLMFISAPKLYYYNWAFELKMLLLVIAIVVQLLLFRRVVAAAAPSRAFAWSSVVLTLAAWFGIGLAGRMIAFI